MNGRIIFRILATVILIAILAGFGVMVYNAGVASGLAASGNLPAPSQAPAPYYYGYGPFLRPWGFGFFPFGFLIPLLFFFLIIALFRGLFFRSWGGPRRHGWGGPYDVPPTFEEWHRRAHEAAANRSEDKPKE